MFKNYSINIVSKKLKIMSIYILSIFRKLTVYILSNKDIIVFIFEIFWFLWIIFSSIIFIYSNRCVVWENSCQENDISKLSIWMSEKSVNRLLWEPIETIEINLESIWFSWEEKIIEYYSWLMNSYLLNQYTISTVSYWNRQKNVACFYILSNWDNDWYNKNLPYYWKLHNIIINKSNMKDFWWIPYIFWWSQFPAALWWFYLVNNVYLAFEWQYNYMFAWNIWWDLDESVFELENLISGWLTELDSELETLWNSENMLIQSRTYQNLLNTVKINMIWFWDEICIKNQIFPFRDQNYMLLDKDIKSK